MNIVGNIRDHAGLWLTPTIACLLLLPIAGYDNLTFHTLAELIAVTLAVNIFLFHWRTFQYSANQLTMFVATGYLVVGLLDLLHLMTYPGMNLFTPGNMNLSTQIWGTSD